MKKKSSLLIILSLCTAIGIGFESCEKDEKIPQQQSEFEKENENENEIILRTQDSTLYLTPIEDVLNEVQIDVRKELYSKLSNEQKYYLWSSHFQYCLDNYDLTSHQIFCIKSWQEFINAKTFDSNPSVSNFYTDYIRTEDLISMANASFEDVKLKGVVFNDYLNKPLEQITVFGDGGSVIAGLASSGTGAILTPNCECNLQHDFCSSPQPSDRYVKCKAETCYKSNFGCGWILMQSCGGLCKIQLQ